MDERRKAPYVEVHKEMNLRKSNILFMIIAVTLTLSFMTSEKKHTLDMNSIRKKFPYTDLGTFRISDTLKAARMNDDLFYDVYQDFTTKPPGHISECGCAEREWKLKGDEYLLSYQGRTSEQDFPFEWITTFSRVGDTARIYLLSYAAKDNKDAQEFPYRQCNKGQLMRPYLGGPLLAEKYSNSIYEHEMYSKLIDTLFVKCTTVERNKLTGDTDSTIEFYGFSPSDMSVQDDRAVYRNGKIITEFLDSTYYTK